MPRSEKDRIIEKEEYEDHAVGASIPDPSFSVPKWEESNFLRECGITSEEVNASGLSWQELSEIHDDHIERIPMLRAAADYVVKLLLNVPEVHSVRIRVKEPVNLVRKIIRKRKEDANREINFASYRDEITDLIGIRAIHLYKEEWESIDSIIRQTWDLNEVPIAYVRSGDPQVYIEAYERRNCNVKQHPRQYRSVHYLLKTAPAKDVLVVELQARTIFEEGWSEIDHRLNYPSEAVPSVVYLLGVMNRVAGIADEMGTLAENLSIDLIHRDKSISEANRERDEAMLKLSDTIAELDVSEVERKKIKAELARAIDVSKLIVPSIDLSSLSERYRDVFESTAISTGRIRQLLRQATSNASALGAASTVFPSQGFDVAAALSPISDRPQRQDPIALASPPAKIGKPEGKNVSPVSRSKKSDK